MSRKARIRNRMILGVFLLIIIVWGLYSLAMNKGKDFLTGQLHNLFQRETKIASLDIRPPFSLEIDEVEVKDLFTVRKVIISPSMIGMLLGRVAFNDVVLISPSLVVKRVAAEDTITAEGAPSQIEQAKSEAPTAESKSKTAGRKVNKRLFFIKDFKIRNGKVSFIDSKVSPEGMAFNFENINASATNLSLSALPKPSKFFIKGDLTSEAEKKATVDFSGKMNLFKKDLNGKLNINSLDLAIFSPYYNSLTNSQIKSGMLDVEADFNSKNNELSITCLMNIKDLLVKEPAEKQDSMLAQLSPFLVGFFGATSGNAQRLSIKGKFIPFKVESINFDINFVKEKMKQLFGSGPEEIIDQAKEVGKIIEDAGKQQEAALPQSTPVVESPQPESQPAQQGNVEIK